MHQIYFTPTTRTLVGLDQIGEYLQVHRRTAWRWINEYGLPAMQTPARTWMTTTSLIDLWILAARPLLNDPRVTAEACKGVEEGLGL